MQKTHLEKHHESTFKVVMILFFILFIAGAVYRMTYSPDPGFPPENRGKGREMFFSGEESALYKNNVRTVDRERIPLSGAIFGLACGAVDLCWAVDSKGSVAYYNGENWQIIDFSFPTSIYDMHCTSQDDCWAVGKSGKIFYYDGDLWVFHSDVGSHSLTAIDCTRQDDCWVAGLGGSLHHFDGSTWHENRAPAGTRKLYTLACEGHNSCWAAGEMGKIYHFDGMFWNLNTDVGTGTFYGVDCYNAVCLVVGSKGSVFRVKGRVWTKMSTEWQETLRSVECLTEDHCWIVGQDGFVGQYYEGKLKEVANAGNHDLLAIAVTPVSLDMFDGEIPDGEPV